jgi:hypothetical protein
LAIHELRQQDGSTPLAAAQAIELKRPDAASAASFAVDFDGLVVSSFVARCPANGVPMALRESALASGQQPQRASGSRVINEQQDTADADTDARALIDMQADGEGAAASGAEAPHMRCNAAAADDDDDDDGISPADCAAAVGTETRAAAVPAEPLSTECAASPAAVATGGAAAAVPSHHQVPQSPCTQSTQADEQLVLVVGPQHDAAAAAAGTYSFQQQHPLQCSLSPQPGATAVGKAMPSSLNGRPAARPFAMSPVPCDLAPGEDVTPADGHLQVSCSSDWCVAQADAAGIGVHLELPGGAAASAGNADSSVAGGSPSELIDEASFSDLFLSQQQQQQQQQGCTVDVSLMSTPQTAGAARAEWAVVSEEYFTPAAPESNYGWSSHVAVTTCSSPAAAATPFLTPEPVTGSGGGDELEADGIPIHDRHGSPVHEKATCMDQSDVAVMLASPAAASSRPVVTSHLSQGAAGCKRDLADDGADVLMASLSEIDFEVVSMSLRQPQQQQQQQQRLELALASELLDTLDTPTVAAEHAQQHLLITNDSAEHSLEAMQAAAIVPDPVLQQDEGCGQPKVGEQEEQQAEQPQHKLTRNQKKKAKKKQKKAAEKGAKQAASTGAAEQLPTTGGGLLLAGVSQGIAAAVAEEQSLDDVPAGGSNGQPDSPKKVKGLLHSSGPVKLFPCGPVGSGANIPLGSGRYPSSPWKGRLAAAAAAGAAMAADVLDDAGPAQLSYDDDSVSDEDTGPALSALGDRGSKLLCGAGARNSPAQTSCHHLDQLVFQSKQQQQQHLAHQLHDQHVHSSSNTGSIGHGSSRLFLTPSPQRFRSKFGLFPAGCQAPAAGAASPAGGGASLHLQDQAGSAATGYEGGSSSLGLLRKSVASAVDVAMYRSNVHWKALSVSVTELPRGVSESSTVRAVCSSQATAIRTAAAAEAIGADIGQQLPVAEDSLGWTVAENMLYFEQDCISMGS